MTHYRGVDYGATRHKAEDACLVAYLNPICDPSQWQKQQIACCAAAQLSCNGPHCVSIDQSTRRQTEDLDPRAVNYRSSELLPKSLPARWSCRRETAQRARWACRLLRQASPCPQADVSATTICSLIIMPPVAPWF